MAEEFALRGVNHIALVCSDVERTIDFYTNVLGLRLVKTINLPDGLGQHIFFDIGNGDLLAFFTFPGAPGRVPGISAPVAMPGRGDIVSAVSSMNHIAFDVEPELMDEYAAKLKAKGIKYSRVMHDDSPEGWSATLHPGVFMRSIYFFDPDGIQLEFACWTIWPDDLPRKDVHADTATR